MPLKFIFVCDLLDDLERLHLRSVPLLPRELERRTINCLTTWLTQTHRRALGAFNTDGEGIWKMLHPEMHAGQEYGLDAETLELLLARALMLSRTDRNILRRYKMEPLMGDFAACVGKVFETTNSGFNLASQDEVTADAIIQALLRIAAFNEESSPEVRALARTYEPTDAEELLGNIYLRLRAREAKWLTRLVLKDLGHVRIPRDFSLGSGDSCLPNFLTVNVNFSSSAPAAIRREGSSLVKTMNPTALPTPPTSSPLMSNKHDSSAHQPPVAPVPGAISATPPAKREDTHARKHHRALRTTSKLLRNPAVQVTDLALPPPRQSLDPDLLNIPRRGPRFHPGSRACVISSRSCLLTNYIFILSPCIAKDSYLKKILAWHGSHFVTSLSAILDPALPDYCQRTGKELRKIILVEMKNKLKNYAFLRSISELQLKQKNGGKLWIQIYDWRLLECITKQEQGKVLQYDPWKRCGDYSV